MQYWTTGRYASANVPEPILDFFFRQWTLEDIVIGQPSALGCSRATGRDPASYIPKYLSCKSLRYIALLVIRPAVGGLLTEKPLIQMHLGTPACYCAKRIDPVDRWV